MGQALTYGLERGGEGSLGFEHAHYFLGSSFPRQAGLRDNAVVISSPLLPSKNARLFLSLVVGCIAERAHKFLPSFFLSCTIPQHVCTQRQISPPPPNQTLNKSCERKRKGRKGRFFFPQNPPPCSRRVMEKYRDYYSPPLPSLDFPYFLKKKKKKKKKKRKVCLFRTRSVISLLV